MPTVSPMLTIDVSHPPRKPEIVEEELFKAVKQVQGSLGLRVLKIVHGYGSSGRGGTTKETVRNWCFRNKGRVKTVIEGEEYTLYHVATQQLRKETGDYPDPDLGASNAGITIVWVK